MTIQQIVIQHVFTEHSMCHRYRGNDAYSSYTLVRKGKQINYTARKGTQDSQGKPQWESGISTDIGHEGVSQADIQGKILAIEGTASAKP